jgi:hypothetical protein
MIQRRLLLPLMLAAASAAPVAAQTAPAAGTRVTPSLRASRAAAIRVDGRLDEAAWTAAEATSSFTEAYPNPGGAPRLRTEARVLYDERTLYVGMRMHDPRPDSIAAQLARRDAGGIYSDWAQVMVDSYLDRRTAFAFAVNPRGVKRDVYLSNDNSEDSGWDAVWDVATTIDSAGWTAEFRIPLSQLRFGRVNEGAERTWGLQLTRDMARYQSRAVWSPWTQNDNGFVSRFGTLTGLVGVRPPTRLELMPYASTRLTRTPASLGDPGRAEGDPDPFYRGSEAAFNVGADVRAGLPLGLTLSATINPDFGQVEADPAVVNLSAFETVLPENRPFFVEGSDLFRFGSLLSYISQGSPQFFYSRRVGREPQRQLGADPGIRFFDRNPQTTILGAAKVTGKTPGGWSIGILDAVTAPENARVLDAEGLRRTVGVEPLSNYLVARTRRDFAAGRTVLGGIATATHRALQDTVFAPRLRSDGYVAGIDGEHSTRDRTWSVSGYLAGSRIGGSESAIGAAQRSSARYYRRPDADYLRYDSTATSLAGHAFGAALRKGGDWRGSVWYQEISPGFEVNDAGILGRTDRRALSALFGRRQGRPGPVFRDWFVRAFTSNGWNFGGDGLDHRVALRGTGTFRNLWSGGATVEYVAPALDDRLTRGGPIVRTPSSWSFSSTLGTDPRKRVTLNGELFGVQAADGGEVRFVYASVSARPTSNIQLSIGPALERVVSSNQYVMTRTDALAANTFGRRYVFATLTQNTAEMAARLNWTFTPNLSLQLYARPFVSAGSYRGFKELEAPRDDRFAVYGRETGTVELGGACGTQRDDGVYAVDPDGAGPASCFRFGNPNFNFRSVRGNAVLRWEYRPGSALFLVWQQQREGQEALGDFDALRDFGELWRVPARNVFLIKATYWIGR